jgi:uncharacterized membrane protein YphA (DoxX/SURF4 family)
MQPATQRPPVSRKAVIVGWILSILPCLLLIFSGVMKLTMSPEVAQGFVHLGWPESLAFTLGILELTCTLLYLIPRTSVLGAILLTGYMGGAIATHVRIGEAVWTHILLGVVIWLGIWLRDVRLRALIPLRQPA